MTQVSQEMDIKGLDQIRKHVPDLITLLGILRFILLPISLFLLITTLFKAEHDIWPFWLLVAEIMLGGLGFGLLMQFFRHRQAYKARFGPLAYSKAASRFGLPAVAIIAAMVACIGYFPGVKIQFFGGNIILPVLGWALTVIGVLLALRVVQTFGFDNLIMLYVYFPEESHLINHKIYDVLRHPAYAALLCIAFGLALLNRNWYSLYSAVIFLLGLWGWVRLFEEKELIQRFGPAYIEYRQRMPAFLPRMRDLRAFFRFMILGR